MAMQIEQIKDLLGSIVAEMCPNQEAISVKLVNTKSVSVFQIKVAKEDYKWLIGKEGNFIRSIRILFSALGKKNGRQIMVELLDEEKKEDQ